MIRKVISKLSDSAGISGTMNYALEKAELVDGSEAKFDGTSIKDYNKLGVKKFNQVNNKFEPKTGRKQEVLAIHEVISFSAKDLITNEKALEIAMSVWKEAIDLDNRKYRVAVHDNDDNGKTHVHLIWNKRDNKGKPYEQKNDYELFEKLCHQAELKHGLEEVKNRKYLKPGMPTNPQGPNEYRLENRGIKSEKTKFKEAVNASTDKAMTAGEFLEFLHADGYTLILNGNTGYSMEKDGQTFKASEVGASYKTLKARFGDDPQFSDTLARLGVKTAPIREMGSIGGDFHDEQSAITERRIKKSNRVLDTRFDSSNDHDFFFKGTNKKAFEYSHSRGRVDFNNTSPMAIKAGLQKLTENLKPQELKVNGPEFAKRGIWLQFHMMGLDTKGFSISGFTPTANDKAQLAKMKQENPAFKKTDEAISAPKNVTATPAVAGKNDRTSHTDLESFTKFKVADTQLQPKTKAQSAAQSGAAGVLAGVVEKLTDMSGSFSGNLMSEKLSEMSSLNTEIKNKRESAENQQHQEKKHRLQKLKPT
ncbi:relaxase [Pseudomonas sp.]|uniref:relaxase/mobilization nuclease domain-containing protein n=1 Tax=Pseudomonas sp. TaxID=306 RepID=UPI0024874462|nr:relaxase [Pseudomonas sp.]MDI1333227.1 relaxase [Pseudomonas sp.]